MTALRRTFHDPRLLSSVKPSAPSLPKLRTLAQSRHIHHLVTPTRAYARPSTTTSHRQPTHNTFSHPARAYSSSTQPTSETQPTSTPEPPDYLSPTERTIFLKLREELNPIRLEVQDISGGCGSMFGLDIVSSAFEGKSVIKQHQMVNKVLKEEIKGWHGMQLKTKAPGG